MGESNTIKRSDSVLQPDPSPANYMVSVEKAKELIRRNAGRTRPVQSILQSAMGMVLSEDVYAPISLPPFHQSAMDGYAFRHEKDKAEQSLKLVGEISAGSSFHKVIQNGEAVRIFTGAMLPSGADTVIEQEKVKLLNGQIVLEEKIDLGRNVRPAGSEIMKGELALRKGTKLNPASLAFLASMGLISVSVNARPEVVLVITGSELQKAGEILDPGKIYESNSIALKMALEQSAYSIHAIEFVKDDADSVAHIFDAYAGKTDVLLLSGGISVGDYDMVRQRLEKDDVQRIFYKIRQKPGKPIWFGTSGKTRIIALPGNPASALTCFYEYVLPMLEAMTGVENPGLEISKAILLHDFRKKAGLSQFLKARVDEKGVVILDAQESFKMSSFSLANAIVYLDEETDFVPKGSSVEIHLLPS